ncbi:MAG TPA: YggT family protein [Gammaproteobacteria bacterium]|nr:YggT family protein [Gammaproteobacteria bacterium]
MQNALIFLVRTLADLYLLAFLLRFILQWVRAGYRNPLSQLVQKITSPLVVPARRILPSAGGLDLPTLIVLVVLEGIVTFALAAIARVVLPVPTFLLYVLLRLIALTLWFYTMALFVYVLLSWFGDRGGGAMGSVLGDIVEPVLRPVRRIVPPIAGLDLSPLLVMLVCQAGIIALELPWFLR